MDYSLLYCQSCTFLVAILSQKAISCSTSNIVGLLSSSNFSICMREIKSKKFSGSYPTSRPVFSHRLFAISTFFLPADFQTAGIAQLLSAYKLDDAFALFPLSLTAFLRKTLFVYILGANTIWYLQFNFVYAKLSASIFTFFIDKSSKCIFCVDWQVISYIITFGGFRLTG